MLCLPIKGLNGECKNKRGGKHRKKKRRHTALDLEASIRFLSHAFVFSVRPAKPRYGFMCLLRVLRDRFPVLTIAREAAEAALAEAQKKCEQLKAELAQYPKNLVSRIYPHPSIHPFTTAFLRTFSQRREPFDLQQELNRSRHIRALVLIPPSLPNLFCVCAHVAIMQGCVSPTKKSRSKSSAKPPRIAVTRTSASLPRGCSSSGPRPLATDSRMLVSASALWMRNGDGT